MFRKYDYSANPPDENDPDNYSFPTNFERFSAANVPKSRLGKRKTIDNSSSIKRDVLKAITSDSDCGLKTANEDMNILDSNPALTHPISSCKTPSRQIAKTLSQRSKPNFNDGATTPCWNDNFTPLKEIREPLNNKNFNSDPNKLVFDNKKNEFGPSQDIAPSLCRNIFHVNSDANDKKIDCPKFTEPHLPPLSNVTFSADSSHSDVGNNSSFMTAHDIYNVDRSRLQETSCFKTPGKGFSIYEMYASPAGPFNSNAENEALKKVLSKTPCLNRFETFTTPFKSINVLDKEICTPSLINNPKTPRGIDKHLSESDVVPNKPNSMDASLREITSEQGFIPKKSSPDENIKSHSPKASPSLSKQILLAGLGWALPRKSIFCTPDKKPLVLRDKADLNPECSSVLLTPNNSTSDHSSNSLGPSHVDSVVMDFDSKSSLNYEREMPTLNGDEPISITSSTIAADKSDDILGVTQPPATSFLTETANGLKENGCQMEISIEESIIGSISSEPVKLSCSSSLVNPSEVSSNGDSFKESSNCNLQSNDSGLCNDETELFTSQKELKENAAEKTIISQSSVESLPREPRKDLPSQDANRNVEEHEFLPPLPKKPFSAPIPKPPPKPEKNVVYVNNKPYTVLSMLGRGGSSEVYQVLDAESSKLMAMKFVNLSSVEECIANGYLNEIDVLSKLQGCPSVIRMFDSEYLPDNKILYVVMEKGDIDFSRLMKDIMKTKKISMSMIIYYWTEMLSCVKDIHQKGIIHSDLKPANFLLVSGRLKLIDFGIASSLQGDMTSVLKDVTTGTFNYMSPEAIRNCGENKGYKITYKSDVWSLGCILYNLLYGRTPFSHLTNTWAKLGAIADPAANVSFPENSSVPPHLLYSVRWALRKDPKERPSASELLELAEIQPSPDSLLADISRTFPNCPVVLEDLKNEGRAAK